MTRWISDAPLSLDALLDETDDERAGALVVFGGMIRNENLGEPVARMRYDVHGPLAARSLEAIEEEARRRFDILSCRIRHRVGDVSLGEPSVWIVVRAKHRPPAYDASRWALEELKRRVPIWKEEFHPDGSSRFLEGTPLHPARPERRSPTSDTPCPCDHPLRKPLRTPEEALAQIMEQLQPLPASVVPLEEALGTVLTDNVLALRAHPPADNSAMDGWALRAEDTEGASAEHPVHLQVVGTSAAGCSFEGELQPGQATRITTGALVPQGATAVVAQEDVVVVGERIALRAALPPGSHIRRRGEEYVAGDVLLPAGLRLRPAAIGLLASAGIPLVRTHACPRVHVLVTGNELVDIAEAGARAEVVVDSNGPLLAAALEEARVPLAARRRVPDDAEALIDALRTARASADVILSTGGASVGPYDLVAHAWEVLGIETVFWKVAMRPGKPIRFGVWRGQEAGDAPTYLFALPGNPLAALTGFERFVRPALDVLRGLSGAPRPRVRLPLEDGRRVGDRAHFVRGSLVGEGAGTCFRVPKVQGSGMLRQAAFDDGVGLLPAGPHTYAAGDTVTVDVNASILSGRTLRVVDDET